MERNAEVDEVFRWLDEGLDRQGGYLRLLGPGRDEWGRRVLANLATVADRSAIEPSLWADLIRERDWRSTLIGCSAVSLTRDPRFFEPLLDQFESHSWVGPQLAVALVLVHPAEATAAFRRIAGPDAASTPSKTLGSAKAALEVIESLGSDRSGPSPLPGDAPPADPRFELERSMGHSLVHHHWRFWTDWRGL